jgi:hypothetical protein
MDVFFYGFGLIVAMVFGAWCWNYIIDGCSNGVECKKCPHFQAAVLHGFDYIPVQSKQDKPDWQPKVKSTIIRGSKVDMWG